MERKHRTSLPHTHLSLLSVANYEFPHIHETYSYSTSKHPERVREKVKLVISNTTKMLENSIIRG